MKSVYWALASLLIAISMVWMSASFFGQLTTIFYCFLGFIGSAVLISDKKKIKRRKKQTVDQAYKAKLLQRTAGELR